VGISQDGYNATASFSSSQLGTQPAFTLSNGFPSNHPVPPNLVSTFDNEETLLTIVRAKRIASRIRKQWNLTVEHQFTDRDYVSASYVWNEGARA
jgi:hypothetical protein